MYRWILCRDYMWEQMKSVRCKNGNAICVDRESEDTDDTNQPSEPSSEASSEPSSESDGDVDETDEKGSGGCQMVQTILGSSL